MKYLSFIFVELVSLKIWYIFECIIVKSVYHNLNVQFGICHGSASYLKVDVCQIEVFNTVDEIFNLQYEAIDFHIEIAWDG